MLGPWAGIRCFRPCALASILAPEALVETFARASVSFVQGVATSLQGIVAEFIEEGYFATHIRRMRRIYAERHAALYEAAQRSLVGDSLRSCRRRADFTQLGICLRRSVRSRPRVLLRYGTS